MKKLRTWIVKKLIGKSAYALPVAIAAPGEWTAEDESWLRHVLGQRSGRKLLRLLTYTPLSLATDGEEKTPFENGKVAGSARVIQMLLYLQGQPELDLEDDEIPEDSKTL